jgi:hypothetical protein
VRIIGSLLVLPLTAEFDKYAIEDVDEDDAAALGYDVAAVELADGAVRRCDCVSARNFKLLSNVCVATSSALAGTAAADATTALLAATVARRRFAMISE